MISSWTSGIPELGHNKGDDGAMPQNKKGENPDIPAIALDSNVFRNLDFLNYLQKHKGRIKVCLPSVVALEIGFFFRTKGFSWEEFTAEIQKFNGVVLEWSALNVPDIITTEYQEKSRLPFKHHFRDFLIGMQCEALRMRLVSYNKSHFYWMQFSDVVTPEEFFLEFERI